MQFITKKIIICLLFLILFQNILGFAHRPIKKSVKKSVNTHFATKNKIVADNASTNKFVAKSLGYVMGLGSLALYVPIILKIIKNKNTNGLSTSTWIFNIVGSSFSIFYHLKKQSDRTTYTELISISFQSIIILGLICFFNEKIKEYFLGLFLLFVTFHFGLQTNISGSMLNLLQSISIGIGNFAPVPQIFLTFRTQKSSWSFISAVLSSCGNGIRIFTNIQLNKDKILLTGSIIGLILNSILIFQTQYFK